jgi:hypothetical protein
MKNILSIITLLLLATAPSSTGQGYVIFNNRHTGATPVVAPIYGPNPNNLGGGLRGNATTNGGSVDYTGMPLLSGTGFTAELWAENPSLPGEFQPLSGSKVPFRTSASLAGFFQTPPSAVVVPWVTVDGTPTRFQVRAWDNGGSLTSTWLDALLADRPRGFSDIFTAPVSAAPGTPSSLIGLTSFNIFPLIPEPSVVLLGALAGIALLWRRRAGRKA